MIRWFVGLWDHRESALSLALVRISLGLVLLFDLLEAAWLGLVPTLWGPDTTGGLASNLMSRDPLPELYAWFPEDPMTAVVAFWVLVVALSCFTAGFGTRMTGVITVLLYAQLARVLPLGDRGIDLMLRNVICLLILSRSHATLSVDAWLKTRSWWSDELIPAWPRHLLILQLVVMYFFAGIQKTAITWLPLGGYGALYIVLQDPHIARFDMSWLDSVYPLTQIATGVTHNWEITAPLVLLAWHFRATQGTGRIRRFYERFQPQFIWVAVGVLLHLGIAATMNLGIFPFAMLALYWGWFHPDELRSAWRARARFMGG